MRSLRARGVSETKRRRSASVVVVWAAFVALAIGGLVLGLGVSSAVSQTLPTTTTAPTETEPPPPDPDPIPQPPPPVPPPSTPPPPPPAPDSSPPSFSSGATGTAPKAKKKAKPERRAKKERTAPTSFFHEPRDPAAVIVGAGLPAGPAFSNSSSTSAGASGSRLIALFLLAGLAIGGLLLALAAIPAWVLRPVRASALIEHWRVQIAATGLSALCMALIIFVLNTSGL